MTLIFISSKTGDSLFDSSCEWHDLSGCGFHSLKCLVNVDLIIFMCGRLWSTLHFIIDYAAFLDKPHYTTSAQLQSSGFDRKKLCQKWLFPPDIKRVASNAQRYQTEICM